MDRLGKYLQENNTEWQQVKELASYKNGWFIPSFIDAACKNIYTAFLNKQTLENWVKHYHIDDNIQVKNVGVVMAGNIPLVGFHDFLAIFMTGHKQTIKLSGKDDLLLKELVNKLCEWEPACREQIIFAEQLKGCDAYIATGSNNSSRYFEQYFAKYPNIIRRNRTAAAILTGEESEEELEKLSDDIHMYFGLGCRNVSKIFVPEGYDFIPLLKSFDKYRFFEDHHKYKNNYDYQLSIILLNNIYYMTNGSTLLTENQGLFSPISHLYFEHYKDQQLLTAQLQQNNDIQCTVGGSGVAVGEAQQPGLFNYADGVDTMQFLLGL